MSIHCSSNFIQFVLQLIYAHNEYYQQIHFRWKSSNLKFNTSHTYTHTRNSFVLSSTVLLFEAEKTDSGKVMTMSHEIVYSAYGCLPIKIEINNLNAGSVAPTDCAIRPKTLLSRVISSFYWFYKIIVEIKWKNNAKKNN